MKKLSKKSKTKIEKLKGYEKPMFKMEKIKKNVHEMYQKSFAKK